jgi:hypothetical protein
MTIEIKKAIRSPFWLVKLDDYPVTFSNQAEALAFVERLKARIAAPHVLPH